MSPRLRMGKNQREAALRAKRGMSDFPELQKLNEIKEKWDGFSRV
jgi:hypothetical protein